MSYTEKIQNSFQVGTKKEKLNMRKRHVLAWQTKPTILPTNTAIIAKIDSLSLTAGKEYKVINHFCTLISTIYLSRWVHFVTLKNDGGWTVKMNLNNFSVKH